MRVLRCPDGCGACCDPVVMPFGPADLQNHRLIDAAREAYPDELKNLLFAREHLTPMRRKEGLAKATYLRDGAKTTFSFTADGEPEIAWSYFYTCDRFDPVTRRCTAYEERPPMCRDYPFYDQPLDDPWNAAKALPEECVYRELLGQPVTMLPTRRRH